MQDSDVHPPSAPDGPLFTAADVALVEEAIRREGQRIFVVCEHYRIVIDPDDHAARLGDLAARLRHCVRDQAQGTAP